MEYWKVVSKSKFLVYSNMENLVLRARSETEGSASEFCGKIPSGDNQSRVLRARIFNSCIQPA